MILKVKNNQDVDAQKSYLATSLASSGTTLYVKNINAFYDNWNVQIGDTGQEKTEIIEINGAPSGSAVNLAATITYDHPADTPVYSIKYNQIYFKRSTAGTAGTATLMTGGTVNITPDSEFTQFDDTGGSAGYAYKTQYYSTGLASSSTETDWITTSGWPLYSQADIRAKVRAKLPGDNYVTDEQIDGWTNEWLERMTNAAIDVNEDYSLGTTSVAYSGTAQEGTITAEDFKAVRRAYYTEDGSNIYMMTKQELVGFQPNETFNATHPYFYMKGENVIGRNPHDASGTIALDYYKLNAVLDSDGDCLPQTMRGYSSSFVKFGLAQAYRKDNKIAEATALEQQAEADLQRFKKEMQPRHKSGPTYIDIVEDVGDSDNDYFW